LLQLRHEATQCSEKNTFGVGRDETGWYTAQLEYSDVEGLAEVRRYDQAPNDGRKKTAFARRFL
jgi:hypothetical protein